MVPDFHEPAYWRRYRSALQFVQRRSVGKLRGLFSGHYALHQRIDHDAVAHRGDSAAWEDGARRWWPAKDHAVDTLRDGRPVHFPGYLLALSFQHPESY